MSYTTPTTATEQKSNSSGERVEISIDYLLELLLCSSLLEIDVSSMMLVRQRSVHASCPPPTQKILNPCRNDDFFSSLSLFLTCQVAMRYRPRSPSPELTAPTMLVCHRALIHLNASSPQVSRVKMPILTATRVMMSSCQHVSRPSSTNNMTSCKQLRRRKKVKRRLVQEAIDSCGGVCFNDLTSGSYPNLQPTHGRHPSR